MFTCYRTHCRGLSLLQHYTCEKIHFISSAVYSLWPLYNRKLSRKKTFANSVVLWLFAKVSSTKFWVVASFGMHGKRKQSAKVFSEKIKSFLPRKFPAMVFSDHLQYTGRKSLWDLVACHDLIDDVRKTDTWVVVLHNFCFVLFVCWTTCGILQPLAHDGLYGGFLSTWC